MISHPKRATVAYNGVARRWNKAKTQTHITTKHNFVG